MRSRLKLGHSRDDLRQKEVLIGRFLGVQYLKIDLGFSGFAKLQLSAGFPGNIDDDPARMRRHTIVDYHYGRFVVLHIGDFDVGAYWYFGVRRS